MHKGGSKSAKNRKDQTMKTFLISGHCQDGEHQHGVAVLLYAETQEEAGKWAQRQVELQQKEFNGEDAAGDDGSEIAYFSFGDGSTLVELPTVKEVPESFALDCQKYGVCYIANPKEEEGKI